MVHWVPINKVYGQKTAEDDTHDTTAFLLGLLNVHILIEQITPVWKILMNDLVYKAEPDYSQW